MKQVFAWMLVLMMLFSLSACGMVQTSPTETGDTTLATDADGFEDIPVVTKPPFKTVYYWVEKKVTKGNVTTTYSRSYDDKGNLTKDACTASDGSVGYSYAYTYDKNGNCLTETCEDLFLGSWSIINTYDESGKLTTKALEKAESKTVTEYTYDESGKLVKTTEIHDMDHQVVTEYSYNRKGFLLKKEVFQVRSGSSEKTHTTEYRYDEYGNQAEIAEYEGATLATRERKIYNEKGQLLVAISALYGDQGKGVAYTYDRFGSVLTEVTGTYRGQELLDIDFYEERSYNERKLLNQRICYSAAGAVTGEYDYQYDAQWNLIKEIEYKYNSNHKTTTTEYKYIGIEMPND